MRIASLSGETSNTKASTPTSFRNASIKPLVIWVTFAQWSASRSCQTENRRRVANPTSQSRSLKVLDTTWDKSAFTAEMPYLNPRYRAHLQSNQANRSLPQKSARVWRHSEHSTAQKATNFVAVPVPAIDESAHTLSLTLDIDQGSVFQLGNLILEGMEVHAGAAKALQNSWTSLKGERFNPRLLDRWLQANQKNCLGCTREMNMSFKLANLKPETVDVWLSLQQP